MKTEEAARYLRFSSVRAFRRWAKEHGIEPCRAGRRKALWQRVALDTFIGACSQTELPAKPSPAGGGDQQEVPCHG